MIELRITTSVPLGVPTADAGLVTWLSVDIVRIGHDDDDDGETMVGSAKVALIHHGEVANVGESLADVLDADSAELEALSDVFYDIDEGWLSEPFDNGNGSNVMYVADISLEPGWEGRSIEQAAVHRLAATIADGSAIVVVPFDDVRSAEPWKRVSFTIAAEPTAERTGYLVLDMSLRHPRIVPADGDDDGFRVLPNPAPGQKRRHHQRVDGSGAKTSARRIGLAVLE